MISSHNKGASFLNSMLNTEDKLEWEKPKRQQNSFYFRYMVNIQRPRGPVLRSVSHFC